MMEKGKEKKTSRGNQTKRFLTFKKGRWAPGQVVLFSRRSMGKRKGIREGLKDRRERPLDQHTERKPPAAKRKKSGEIWGLPVPKKKNIEKIHQGVYPKSAR